LLEETGYIPKDRYPHGPEIRAHCARIVQKWGLLPHALLQTEITDMTWDESILHWHVRTNRDDYFVCQFIVLAVGNMHKPQLPGLEGIERFKRDHFHTSRWNYDITGGCPERDVNLRRLKNTTVGIIGTGVSAVQVVPKLAEEVKKLYVFQRTPSSISIRDNNLTYSSTATTSALKSGWQKARMDEFANILQGTILDDIECSAVEGFEAITMRTVYIEARKAGVEIEDDKLPKLLKLADIRHMESLRNQVEATVKDKTTAEKLKPWYAFMCKRPAFNNDYLAAFNKPNVELVDTDGKGVSHVTETGVVANGREYEVDLLIYSTGFEVEASFTLHRRAGIRLVGKKGQTYDEKWEECGPSTLFGIHIRDFPNVFNIGPAQAGVTANQTHTIVIAGAHIAQVISSCLRAGIEVIEPTEEAVEDWGKQIEKGSDMRTKFHKMCPPGYYNREGKPEEIPARWGFYPEGIVKWSEVLGDWREEGSMRGLEKR
jgi:cation diffusion facilitator CzcD-associated flavoprotein CzcO